MWEGTSLHFVGPIYSTGQLNPKYEKMILGFSDDPENFSSAFPEKREVVRKVYLEAKVDGYKRWVGMNSDEQRRFLSTYIKRKRKLVPAYANCGDKFLLPD